VNPHLGLQDDWRKTKALDRFSLDSQVFAAESFLQQAQLNVPDRIGICSALGFFREFVAGNVTTA
jgi:hypothetical protein